MGKPKKDESDYFKNKKDTNQRPGESYNIIASLAAGIPSIVMGVDAYMKRNEARDNLKTQQGYVDTLMKQYMETPIYNPYENLSVATQANQIKMEETDKALANTLDTLRAQGASAGGATALAQAALKSKAGIAADIEKQEVMNERLKAQGEIMVQNAEMQRKGQQMDYEQSKADQSRMEQFAYGERAADMAGALGSLGLQVARGLGGDNASKKALKANNKLMESQVEAANQVTSGVDVDALTSGPTIEEQMAQDTFDDLDQPIYETDAFGNVTDDLQYNFLQNPGMPSFDPSFGNPNDEAHQRTLSKMEKIKLDRMTQEERAKYLTRQYIGTNFKI
tara:strand:+ start:5817 stop:6824 length:1008 start_codon:yes stop_codon:yes gene_type:complete